ncbi:uncharacterized protein LOC104581774 [Brachypodium distachyon]|uniref:uncharacterized protein LOC104581774 n=1 Tax=Brachypodium distachyon TaxID=15368 RepID=UPI00052FF7D4|nr:uncharacterized protein LOC104581774 [Brachypodium distachyon]|eukprot:XP_010228598.1 uncharacterized protein LOC104581774 [Brachypodium distachyon]
MGLGSVVEMWTHLRQRYQPSGDSIYLSMVRQEHALQQGDSTVDEFYTESSAIWRQLDSLRTAICGSCTCCQIMRSDLEFQRIHEFLSRLRPEFEARRAQLFTRGRVPLSEVLSEIRAEETRLRGAGLLAVPSVLAARAPAMPSAAPVSSRYSTPPLLPTPGGEGRPTSGGAVRSRPRPYCNYCQKPGHVESDCFKKQRDMRNKERASSFGSRAPPSMPSTMSFTQQDIVQLKRLLAASGSSSTATAGSVTGASSTGSHRLLSQDRRKKVLVGAGPRHHDSQGLWELDWLRVPSSTTTPTSSHALAASASASFQQWHHRLGHLCGSRLSSLVRRGRACLRRCLSTVSGL